MGCHRSTKRPDILLSRPAQLLPGATDGRWKAREGKGGEKNEGGKPRAGTDSLLGHSTAIEGQMQFARASSSLPSSLSKPRPAAVGAAIPAREGGLGEPPRPPPLLFPRAPAQLFLSHSPTGMARITNQNPLPSWLFVPSAPCYLSPALNTGYNRLFRSQCLSVVSYLKLASTCLTV